MITDKSSNNKYRLLWSNTHWPANKSDLYKRIVSGTSKSSYEELCAAVDPPEFECFEESLGYTFNASLKDDKDVEYYTSVVAWVKYIVMIHYETAFVFIPIKDDDYAMRH